jgi:PBP1b-binding outer membrane lipoprotein LpoB
MKMKQSIKVSVLFLVITVFMSSCSITRLEIPTPEAETKNVETESDNNSNFIKANEWMVQSFNDAKSVIQFKDKEAGIVKGKYLLKAGVNSTSPYVQSSPSFYSIITIRVKDDLARIEINAPSGMFSFKVYGIETGFTKEMFLAKTSKLINEFEIYMKKKSSNDNW